MMVYGAPAYDITYGLGKMIEDASTHLLLADVLIYWDAMKRFRRPSLCDMDPDTCTSNLRSGDASMSAAQQSCTHWPVLSIAPPTT